MENRGTRFGLGAKSGIASGCVTVLLAGAMLFFDAGLVGAESHAPVSPWDTVSSQQTSGMENPADYSVPVADVGEFRLYLSNDGHFYGMGFPKTNGASYLSVATIWFGCVRGTDTLIVGDNGTYSTVKLHFHSPIMETSNQVGWETYDPSAKADQQFYAVYCDTPATPDNIDPRTNLPRPAIGIEIHQTSYVWTAASASRFILTDCWIRNISDGLIPEGAVGIYMDGDLYGPGYHPDSIYLDDRQNDDLCGLLRVVPALVPGYRDSMDIAWIADNDGDARGLSLLRATATGAIGVRVLRAPKGARLNFNWWASLWERQATGWLKEIINWGPGGAGIYYGGSPGEPRSELSWYQMMVNGEIDYDQEFAASDMRAQGWNPPPSKWETSLNIADGLDSKIFLTYGPFGPIPPGDSVPFTFAIMVGANFHRDLNNFRDRFNYGISNAYMDHLDFSDLIVSARWADWIFDNPGVDSDTLDGIKYRGEAHLFDCEGVDTVRFDTVVTPGGGETTYVPVTASHGCDSVFYKGDGIADIRGPQPPVPPKFRLITEPAQVTVRWDGSVSETVRDPVTAQRDLEGYRVYVGRSAQADQFSLVANWDREDFRRLVFDTLADGGWRVVSYPYTLDKWRSIMRDSTFDPRAHPDRDPAKAYRDTFLDTLRNYRGEIVEVVQKDRLSCWLPESNNYANSFTEDGVPVTNQIQQVGERDTVIGGYAFKYGVYEMVLRHLQPSMPIYVAVTTVDFGDFPLKLGPLETAPISNYQYCQPVYSADVVVEKDLKVGVYPNPYKLIYNDAQGRPTTYFLEGYEAHGKPEHTEYDRRINFINLPDTATITIYSLDGDLIRQIVHPDKFLSSYSSVCSWDLVSRNAMAVTSGIYIYKVTSKLGSQVGKIVIIK